MNIRTARIEDADDLAALLRALDTFQHIQAESPSDTQERVRKQLQHCLSDGSHTMFLAHDGQGKLAGYLSIHWLPYLILRAPEGYVSELFVHPDSRNQGVGKLLLNRAVHESETRGCSRLSLINLRDRESYQHRFYAKQGWKERESAANFIYSVQPKP